VSNPKLSKISPTTREISRKAKPRVAMPRNTIKGLRFERNSGTELLLEWWFEPGNP
jgi:hypothetical protein